MPIGLPQPVGQSADVLFGGVQRTSIAAVALHGGNAVLGHVLSLFR